MARLEYFVVAEFALVDSATNKASIINVLEEISPPSFPTLFTQEIAATCMWRAEAGDYDKDWQMILRVKLPNGEPRDFSMNFRFSAGSQRHRIIQRLQGLPIPAPGNLVFEVLLNGEHQAEHVVTVRAAPPPDAAPPAVQH